MQVSGEKILITITIVCINFILGAYHGSLVKRMEKEFEEYGKSKTKIKHGWWGWMYVGITCLAAWLYGEKHNEGFNWWLVLDSFLIRKIVFDTVLNKFRGLKFFYISPEVKNVTGLWDALMKGKTIDWIHYKIYGEYPQIYFILYLASVVIITINKL